LNSTSAIPLPRAGGGKSEFQLEEHEPVLQIVGQRVVRRDPTEPRSFIKAHGFGLAPAGIEPHEAVTGRPRVRYDPIRQCAADAQSAEFRRDEHPLHLASTVAKIA